MATENDKTLDNSGRDTVGTEDKAVGVEPSSPFSVPDLAAVIGRAVLPLLPPPDLRHLIPDLMHLGVGYPRFPDIQRIITGWAGSSGVTKPLAAITGADKVSKQLELALGAVRPVYDGVISAHLDAMRRDMARSAALVRDVERSIAVQGRLEVASSALHAYDEMTAASVRARSMMRDMEQASAAARKSQWAYEVKNLALQNFAFTEADRSANRLAASLAAGWGMPKLDLLNMPLFKAPDLHLLSGSANILADWYDSIERGERAFEGSQYSFLEEFVTGEFAMYLGRMDPAQREAELADCMWRLTRSRAFGTILQRVFMCHPDLNTRWDAVSQGLSAHRRGHYHAAVRTLLPEIEGVFTQLLLARGEAIIHGGKPHAVGSDGNVLLNRNGNVIGLSGLSQKLNRCRPADDPELKIVADRFLRSLPPDRNRTLHGEDGAAGNRSFSTRLVWGLYALGYVSAVDLHARGALVKAVPMAEARTQAERVLDKARIFLPSDVFQAG